MLFPRRSAARLAAAAGAFACAVPGWAAAPVDDELSEVLVLGQLEETLPQQLGHLGSRSSEVLWLVDGIRINNRLYSTTTPLDTIPAHQVERIEILEGGQGLFYGTQSVAGTVNVVTKQFADEPGGRVELGLDTNDGRHLSGCYRTAIGAHRLAAFASKDKADGFKPFSDTDYQPSGTDRERGYDVTNYGVKYAYDFGDRVRTSFGYQHTDADLDFARPFSIASASNDRNEDLLTAKVDIVASDSLDLYVKGYYHDWDTLSATHLVLAAASPAPPSATPATSIAAPALHASTTATTRWWT